MPTFAICRTEKIKSWAVLAKSVGHNARTSADDRPHLVQKLGEQPAWADPGLHVLAGAIGWHKAWQTEVETMHLRKLAQGQAHTLAREFFLGASPEFFAGKSRGDVDAWATANMDWLTSKFGAERVKFAALHLDEQSPHLAVYVVPLKRDPKGRGNGWTLSDNALGLGGNKAALVELQTDYAQAMERFALHRGVRGSKATHQTVAAWRKRVARPLPATRVPTPPQATLADRIDIDGYGRKVAKSAAEEVFRQFRPMREQAESVPTLRHQLAKLLAELAQLRPLIDAYKRRQDVFAKALAMLIGFAPDLDSQHGMTKTVEAVEDLRRQLHGDESPADAQAAEAPRRATPPPLRPPPTRHRPRLGR